MILIDAAVGSNEFEEPLRKMGLPVQVTHLDSGDFAFMGRGEKGAPLYIGIEFKKLKDVVDSLQSERLQGHQLLEMVQHFDRRYLIVEGDFHHDDAGRAVVFRGSSKPTPLPGAVSAVVLEQRLFNLQTRAGLISRHTTGRRDTLRVLYAWYRYWTDKDLDQHKSHLAVYAPDIDPELFVVVSDQRKAIKCLCPGIGDKASKTVEQWVGGDFTLLCRKTIEEWAALELPSGDKGAVKKLGMKRAERIWNALRGRNA